MVHLEENAMQGVNKNYILLISILAVTGLIAIGLNYFGAKPATDVDLSTIPIKVNGWLGKEIPVEADVNAILETESILMREYRKGNDKIWLAIVYYKDSKVSLHLPESCYTGQGSQIVERGTEKINDQIIANKFVLKGDKGNQIVLYYFESGDYRTHSYQSLRWNMILNRLKRKSNSGALVRYSIPIGQDQEASQEKLKNFIAEFGELLPKYLI